MLWLRGENNCLEDELSTAGRRISMLSSAGKWCAGKLRDHYRDVQRTAFVKDLAAVLRHSTAAYRQRTA